MCCVCLELHLVLLVATALPLLCRVVQELEMYIWNHSVSLFQGMSLIEGACIALIVLLSVPAGKESRASGTLEKLVAVAHF